MIFYINRTKTTKTHKTEYLVCAYGEYALKKTSFGSQETICQTPSRKDAIFIARKLNAD